MINLIPMEYKNQRIITTKFLAEVYGTKEENIKTNFNNNKDRFVEDKHYFQLTGRELRAFKGVVNNINDPAIRYCSVLTLWTERGAARHAKILDTDEAWAVYEELEEAYFNVKQQKTGFDQMGAEIEMLHKLFDIVVLNANETKRLSEEITGTKEKTAETLDKTVILEGRINNLDGVNIEGTPRQRLNMIMKKYAYDKGIAIPTAWQEFRRAFNAAYKVNIEQRKNNYQGKLSNMRLSYPAYLEKVGLIEDALRVADKMMNLEKGGN